MPGPSCTPPGPGGHVMALGTAASPMRSAKPQSLGFGGQLALDCSGCQWPQSIDSGGGEGTGSGS